MDTRSAPRQAAQDQGAGTAHARFTVCFITRHANGASTYRYETHGSEEEADRAGREALDGVDEDGFPRVVEAHVQLPDSSWRPVR